MPRQWLDVEIRAFGEQLRAPAETGRPDRRTLRKVGEFGPIGRHQDVVRRRAFGHRGDGQPLAILRRDVLQRVDGGVGLACPDALVEAVDERAGLAEAMDELVTELVARRLDFEEFDLVTATLQGVAYRPGLPEREIRPARGQPERRGTAAH